MFDLGQLNIWVVLVAWLINMAVGAFWYSPAGFSKAWQRYTGIDIMKIPADRANKILASVATSALVQAFALGFVVAWVAPATLLNAILWLSHFGLDLSPLRLSARHSIKNDLGAFYGSTRLISWLCYS